MDRRSYTHELNNAAAPPRCLGCAYVLIGLPSPGTCPECNREFDLLKLSSFTRLRPFLGWRYWLTGFGIAASVGIALLLVDVLLIGAWGWSIWLGVPLMMGFLGAYFVRAQVYWMFILALGLIGALALGIGGAGLGGVFCAMILGGVALVPMGIGMLGAWYTRFVIGQCGYRLPKKLIVFLVMGASMAMAVVDRITAKPEPLRSVSTSVEIHEPIDLVWASVQFYEEVRHDPPLILRVGLVRPLYTTGSSSKPGEIKTCVYNKGRLVKKTTAVQAPQRLDFEVIEQHIGYERDVRLRSGSFVLSVIDPQTTRVTLTTTYEPLLKPRFIWAWGESWAIHTLHEHVMEGMRRNAHELRALHAQALRHEETP